MFLFREPDHEAKLGVLRKDPPMACMAHLGSKQGIGAPAYEGDTLISNSRGTQNLAPLKLSVMQLEIR